MNPYIAFCRKVSLVAVACSSLAMGCGGAPDPTGDGAPVATNGIYGTALYQKSVGADHFVQFWEFDPGSLAIRESLSIDNGEAPIFDGSWKFETLTEVFARLNPGAIEVPSRILEADGRRAELRAQIARLKERAAPCPTRRCPCTARPTCTRRHLPDRPPRPRSS